MVWRWFRSSKSHAAIDPAWWRAADAVADSPTREGLAALPFGPASGAAGGDDSERQAEMLSGLEELVALVARHAEALPVVPTQHRVIGADQCHFIAPVSVGGEGESAGKLFLTSARLVVVGQRPQAWAWHRVRRGARSGRDLVVNVAGAPDDLLLRCNTFGEALVATWIIRRLTKTSEVFLRDS